MNYYELLGIPDDAPRELIRATYRVLVARAHPDINAAPDAERQTALLNEAWSVLRDPATRAAYDASGLATSAALRCQRCMAATPELRFVIFSLARGVTSRNEGTLVCPPCRKLEARAAALSSLVRGRYETGRRRRVTFGAFARDVRGGKVDARTSAALLRQIGFAYARANEPAEALAALQAVLDFGEDPAVARIVARLREAEAPNVVRPARPAAASAPGSGDASRPGRPQWLGGAGLAAAAAVVIIAIGSARFGLGGRPFASVTMVPSQLELARNVDPTLRDDVKRLANLVHPSDRPPDRAYLFDLPSDKAFAHAYESAVATLPQAERANNPWLVTLETTSQPTEAVVVPQADGYVLARGCEPRACDDGFVSIAYNAAKHVVAGAAYFGDRWHVFGSDALADRAMVVLAVARNRLPLGRRLVLDPAGAAELHRFVDSI